MPDMSLLEFIEHLAGMNVAIAEAEHHALERAAKLVQAEAQREIGDYQPEAGPLAEWAALADSTIADKEKLGYAPPDNPLLRSGGLRDSIEHAVGKEEAVIGSDSPVAEYQELGTTHIPPRSFLGSAGFRKAQQVAEILGAAPVVALVGEGVVNRYLGITT